MLREEKIGTDTAVRVLTALSGQGLIPREGGLQALVGAARAWARRLAKAESVEGGLGVDPNTGAVVASAKVKLRTDEVGPAAKALTAGTDLLEAANAALDEADLQVWIALDRLDVAFLGAEEIETDALRALFRVYLDFQAYDRIVPKIFIRLDIWDRITDEGFREASHIIRSERLDWHRDSLLNLIIRRAVENRSLLALYGVEARDVLESVGEQEALFYRMFPQQVEGGENQVATLDWMISRTRDGLGQTVPREVIHLLTSLQDEQLERLELGHDPPDGEQLFDRAAFRAALRPVSESRLKQTLYPESPKLKKSIEALRGGVTAYALQDLEKLWASSTEDATIVADALVGVGFLSDEVPTTSVPFLYRQGLDLNGRSRGEVAEATT